MSPKKMFWSQQNQGNMSNLHPTVTGANELRRNLLENSCFVMLYSIIQCDALLYKEVSMQFEGGG